MLIHLGKVYLGQSDRLKVTSEGSPGVLYIERANNPCDAGRPQLDGVAIYIPDNSRDPQNSIDNPPDAELDAWADEVGRAGVRRPYARPVSDHYNP